MRFLLRHDSHDEQGNSITFQSPSDSKILGLDDAHALSLGCSKSSEYSLARDSLQRDQDQKVIKQPNFLLHSDSTTDSQVSPQVNTCLKTDLEQSTKLWEIKECLRTHSLSEEEILCEVQQTEDSVPQGGGG